MIKYQGLKTKGKVHYIVFSNDRDNIVEVPIAKEEHDRIAVYLDKITTVDRKHVERGNDEPSE
tara:strand:+ start:456 stop:644 length:189 start_codon:yes stop_codon:yes gene_type:complete